MGKSLDKAGSKFTCSHHFTKRLVRDLESLSFCSVSTVVSISVVANHHSVATRREIVSQEATASFSRVCALLKGRLKYYVILCAVITVSKKKSEREKHAALHGQSQLHEYLNSCAVGNLAPRIPNALSRLHEQAVEYLW